MGKNKWMIIGGVVAIVVVLVVGGFFFMSRKPVKVEEQTESVLQENQEVKKVESSVSVALAKSADGKKATLTIEGIPDKYKTIEYELSYTASGDTPRGVLGTIEVTSPSYEKEIVLGSCSTNICTYDEGVSEVKLQLRFNTDTGESRVFEKTFSF